MAASTRPGNPDRGWNDPPMFLYNSDGKVQPSSRKNPLTQRVGVHQSYVGKTPSTTGINPGLPQIGMPTALLSNSATPLQPFTSPQTVHSVTLPARSSEVKVEDDPSQELPNDICDTSVAKLRSVLESCEEKLKVRVAEDIKKRIDILSVSWKTDKLCKAVQQRMASLSTALSEREYNKAHDVHLSLMVDYVSEVSQWMVGIKRLIMEARTLLPHPPSPPAPEPTEEGDGKQITSVDDTARDDMQQEPGDSVNDLVPPCSALATKDEHAEHVPSHEANVDVEGELATDEVLSEQITTKGEPQELDDTGSWTALQPVSQPLLTKTSDEGDNNDAAGNKDSPQDEVINS